MRDERETSKMVRLLAGAAVVVAAGAFANAQSVLVDLGNNDSWRGESIVGSDANGNYWNSVWSGAYYAGLVDSDNNVTSMNLGFSSAGGTDYYNGPSGDTEDSNATVYNAAALGMLGINGAVYDYYTNSTIELQGLDVTKTYDITFYGSHKYNANNTTRYSIYSDNTYTTVVDSGTLLVGVNADHNQDQTLTLSGLSPQVDDILYIKFEGDGGTGEGYLNAMQIDVVPTPSAMALLAVGGLSMGRRSRRS